MLSLWVLFFPSVRLACRNAQQLIALALVQSGFDFDADSVCRAASQFPQRNVMHRYTPFNDARRYAPRMTIAVKVQYLAGLAL